MTDGPRPEKTLFIILGLLAIGLFLAPFLNESGTVLDLDGSTGIIDNQETWDGMDPVSYLLYYGGDLSCHQKEARTLIINGNEMPVCARDTGLFIGAPLGFLFLGLRPRSVPWAFIIILATPMVLDGGVQLITEYESNNALRLLTGTGAGMALAFGMMRLFDDMGLKK